jgi:hypothetical protein
MKDDFVQRHLDAIKVTKAMHGMETFYVTCDCGTEGAINIPGTNKWIREISIHNIKKAFEMKEILKSHA